MISNCSGRTKAANQKQKSMRSKLKKVYEELILESKKSIKEILSMPVDESNALFCSSYFLLLQRIGLCDGGEISPHNMNRSYLTIYNNIMKKQSEVKKNSSLTAAENVHDDGEV